MEERQFQSPTLVSVPGTEQEIKINCLLLFDYSL